MMRDDSELLRTYAESGSEDAFAELVRRHVDFVHSVAMRRGGGDPHLAKDVTQKVFIALAQNAPRLTKYPVLAGWLFTTAKNAVLKVRRDEERLRRRQEELATMYDADQTPDSSSLRERLMDELDRLDEKDREVVLLRFFQGWQFSRIGEALRLTEDAARMRVERALGRIRVSLEKSGVASSGAVISAALADNAGLAAPAGLVGEITRVSLAAGTQAHLATNTMTLVSSVHIISAISTLAVLVGIGGAALYFQTESNQVRRELNEATIERIDLDNRARLAEPFRERAIEAPAVAGIGNNVPLLGTKTGGSPIVPREGELKDSVTLLKERLAREPSQSIPEISLLGDAEWARIAASFPPGTEAQYEAAFLVVRNRARVFFAALAANALRDYIEEHHGALPKNVSDLAANIRSPIPDAVWERYAMIRSGNVSNTDPNASLVGEIDDVPVEGADAVIRFGRTPQSISLVSVLGVDARVERAINRYMSANNGTLPETIAHISGYLSGADLLRAEARLTVALSRIAQSKQP